MKVVFKIHFRYGDMNYYTGSRWRAITQDDIFKMLRKVTSIKEFQCQWDSADRIFKVSASITPMPVQKFQRKLIEQAKTLFGKDMDLNLLDQKLERGEVGKYETSLFMGKIEGEEE